MIQSDGKIYHELGLKNEYSQSDYYYQLHPRWQTRGPQDKRGFGRGFPGRGGRTALGLLSPPPRALRDSLSGRGGGCTGGTSRAGRETRAHLSPLPLFSKLRSTIALIPFCPQSTYGSPPTPTLQWYRTVCQGRRRKTPEFNRWVRRPPGRGHGNPLNIPAWRIPCTEEPGRFQSGGSQRVRRDSLAAGRHALTPTHISGSKAGSGLPGL